MSDFNRIKKELEEHIKNTRTQEALACLEKLDEWVNESHKPLIKTVDEKFLFLTENILDVIWVLDLATMQFTYISPSVKKLTGYTVNEIMSRPVSEVFTTSSMEKLNIFLPHRLKLFEEDPSVQEVYIDELEQPLKNGGTVLTEVISYLRLNPENKHIEVICTSRDITDRKNAQVALKQVRERLKILTDLTIEGLLIHDNGRIVDINPACEKMLGVDMDMIINSSIYDYIHPDYQEMIRLRSEEKIPGKYEAMLVRSDGSVFPVEIEANYITIKGKTFRVAAIRDITEQKKTEVQINKFLSAITQSPAAIVITDTEGNIEYVNPQFTKITGYSFDEAIGKNPSILKSGLTNPEVYAELWNTLKEGNIWKGEILNKRKDGAFFWESATMAPIKNDRGVTISYLAVKEDITAKKEAEQALIQSQQKLQQANATKDKFFSIIAHDLKNPFNIILGFADLLLQNHKEYDEDTRESVIKTIYDISLKTFNLLENLLAWSRTQTGKIPFSPKVIDLQTLTNDSISLFKEIADKKRIKLTSMVTEDLSVFADRDMVATVLRNLIVNGIKFTPREGKVMVLAEKSVDNMILIEVKDSGIGISPEKIEVIFSVDRDWSESGTEEESGTGLGLFLCKEFVEKNGGRIWLESEVSVGTSFFFTLPVSQS
ncbi:MAG TPA: PAS domain S-box protein [Bacteroidales bacterium]|nr:PAS domain S-box protein [Bacteroidales bacterium]